MPIPLLLLGATFLAGLVGVAAGMSAAVDNETARRRLNRAKGVFDWYQSDLQKAHAETASVLKQLGELKLNIWDKRLGRFVQLYERIQNIELTGHAAASHYQLQNIGPRELAEMKRVALQASEVVASGTAALGAGALAGIASYGGAMMFASASTGTAISALSGAAATNATLAWFGGGSLATGGLGVAGGMAVLGGLVAGPVLAVGGLLLAARARENSAHARSQTAETLKATGEIRQATTLVRDIGKVADGFQSVILQLDKRMGPVLDEMETAIQQNVEANTGPRNILGLKDANWTGMTTEQQQRVYIAVTFAQVMKTMLEAPLISQMGALDPNSSQTLEQGEKFLAGNLS